MSEKEEKGQEVKKKQLGRPKKVVEEDQIVDEKSQERLDMSKDKEEEDYTIEEITQKWSTTFNKLVEVSGGNVGNSVITKWNKLNPFLQNERIKRIYTQAKTYKKKDICKVERALPCKT